MRDSKIIQDLKILTHLWKSDALDDLLKFKVLTMAYKTLYGLGPIHLRDYGTLAATDMCGSNAQAVSYSL